MSKIHTEKKKLTSFDKSFSSKINFIRPDKYSDLESIKKFKELLIKKELGIDSSKLVCLEKLRLAQSSEYFSG